ncbi:alpha/beta fold hydrolase [Streptomyces sp. NPDC052012]|uniref:alpha/beta hydrolase n=1 Tax=Streptomyces sp. NPDC052012 TaxID=3155051 RepID=UPI00344E464B
MPLPRIRGLISAHRRRTALLTALVTGSTVLAGPDLASAGGAPTPSSAAAPRLDWRQCVPGSDFDCATAEMPLDHGDPDGRTLDLAVIRRKATDPGRRIGTLFFNPGGPGGPGTVQMPQNYAYFPREVRERFDIVSWDPRGIGSSTAVNCFANPEEAAEWNAGKAANFPVGEAERRVFLAAYKDLTRRCEQRAPELLRHVSTADTARDLDRLRQAVGDPQLTYLGISYGTILGATYANLFPGKVRAMVLDGDWDPQAWTNHASDEDPPLTSFLRLGADRGAQDTLEQFLTLCGAAPTDRCAFSAGTAEATRDKFDRLMRRLRKDPVDGWTYAATVGAVVNGLYVVHPGWTDLARTLQDLWQGRAPEPSPLPPGPAVPDPNPYLGEEQATSVLCGDSPNPRDPDAYHALAETTAARTGDTGRHWTWASVACATWPVAAHRYRGPWNKPTDHPVLVIGNTHDPATPLSAARAMAGELADARLLTNDGYGHTALLNPSSCVQNNESRYLVDGILPPPGTTCRQDRAPFATPRPTGGIATGGGGTADTVS